MNKAKIEMTKLGIRMFRWVRPIWNRVAQWMMGETPKMDLIKFESPWELAGYLERFQYRADPMGGKFDYMSSPENFQWRLENRDEHHGDCDDFAGYIFEQLQTMLFVSRCYYLTVRFNGGGHAVCVFKWAGTDKWYLWDYEIYEIHRPAIAPEKVAQRYKPESECSEVYYATWEDKIGRLTHISPRSPAI